MAALGLTAPGIRAAESASKVAYAFTARLLL